MIWYEDFYDGVDYFFYEGMEICGWLIIVILGGKVMLCDGELEGYKGDG